MDGSRSTAPGDAVAGLVRSIRDDEVEDWCACPRAPGEAGFDEWVERERSWVAEHHETTSNLFVYTAGGEILGKYDVPMERRGHWRLWAPWIRVSAFNTEVMQALCHHIRETSHRRGVRDVQVILEGDYPHLDLAQSALVSSGFTLLEERVLVRRNLDDTLAPAEIPGLEARSSADLTPEALEELCQAIGIEAEDSDIDARRSALNPGSVVLRRAEACVGLALCASSPGEETLRLHHLGIVSGARGQGLGRALLLAVLARAQQSGGKRYLGSTGKGNAAMRAVFASVECTPFAERFVYALDRPPVRAAST